MHITDDITAGNAPDELLAEQAGDGCRESFHQLVHRYYQRILFFVLGRVRNHQDAEDIVQEAFLNAYRGIEGFDSRYRFKTWLFTIAHNCMVSHFRKKSQSPRTTNLPEIASQRLQHERSVDDADHARLVWNTARRLPADQFNALWLRYHEQMDIESIAHIMDKTPVNVRVILHRARNSVAAMMSGEVE